MPYLAQIGQRLEELDVALEHVTEDGHSACIEWVQRSNSSGRAQVLRGSSFVTLRDGVLVEQRDYFDYRSSLRS